MLLLWKSTLILKASEKWRWQLLFWKFARRRIVPTYLNFSAAHWRLFDSTFGNIAASHSISFNRIAVRRNIDQQKYKNWAYWKFNQSTENMHNECFLCWPGCVFETQKIGYAKLSKFNQNMFHIINRKIHKVCSYRLFNTPPPPQVNQG